MAAFKLYLPYGNLRTFANHGNVTLHYFVKDRPETQLLAPYAQLIMGYGQMNAPQKEAAEGIVREFFSEEEYHALRDYLRSTKNEDLRISMVTAPINTLKPGNEQGLRLTRPFTAQIDSTTEASGFYRLSDEPGYSLPFAVWGFYTEPQR